MSAVVTASESSVAYLRDLVRERFGVEVPEEQIDGLSQAAISAKINAILAEDGVIETSDEQREQVASLAEQLGINVEPGDLAAKANRQIRSMTRQLQRRDYVRGASDFEAFLGTLRPATDTEDIPF